MKEMFNKVKATVLLIIGIISLISTTACGTIQRSYQLTEEQTEIANNLLKYKRYSNGDIEEGSSTALLTISHYLGSSAKEKEDYYPSYDMKSTPVFGNLNDENAVYLKYDMELFDENTENIAIFFLYKDDTALIEVDDNSFSCMTDSGIVNSNFEFEDGAFSWREGNVYHAIFGPADENFYRPTSIWIYNKETGFVTHAWENVECPIWAHYVEQANQ